MLPVIDKPLIQYAVEEAIAAGIEQFIFVTGRGKSAIEDHFDYSFELETMLSANGNTKTLETLRSLVRHPGSTYYIRQQEPLGLGHAVWCARHLIGDEPFAVLSADDFILSSKPCLQQMTEAYKDGNMVAIMDVPNETVSRYGIFDVEEDRGKFVFAKGVIEKPSLDEAPSNIAIIGRYILLPEVFNYLDLQKKGAGGEIQLTDAFIPLIDKYPFMGFRFEGNWFDCGSKEGLLKANINAALERDELKGSILQEIEDISKRHNRNL